VWGGGGAEAQEPDCYTKKHKPDDNFFIASKLYVSTQLMTMRRVSSKN
jgi:hypothetical protein